MKEYQEAFRIIETAVEGLELLRKTAFKQYSVLVDAVVNDRITDVGEIERIMDGLLDFGDNNEFLELYKKICRHVYHSYPEMVGEHIALWKSQFMERIDEDEENTNL